MLFNLGIKDSFLSFAILRNFDENQIFASHAKNWL